MHTISALTRRGPQVQVLYCPPRKIKTTRCAGGFFVMYTHGLSLVRGTVSTVPLFLSHTALTYRQGRSVDMIRVYPDGDGEDANDSRCGPPYFYVGKFCFFLVFVLSNQTEAGTPCPFKAIWSGYGRRSVFFSAG